MTPALLVALVISAQSTQFPGAGGFSGTFTGPATVLATNDACNEALAMRWSSDTNTGWQLADADNGVTLYCIDAVLAMRLDWQEDPNSTNHRGNTFLGYNAGPSVSTL